MTMVLKTLNPKMAPQSMRRLFSQADLNKDKLVPLIPVSFTIRQRKARQTTQVLFSTVVSVSNFRMELLMWMSSSSGCGQLMRHDMAELPTWNGAGMRAGHKSTAGCVKQ